MNRKGLTLIELMGAVVIFGLMISLVSIVIQFVLRANDRVVEQSRATRLGTLLVEDIQEAFNDLSPTSYQTCGDHCIELITAYENQYNESTGEIEYITHTPPLSYTFSIEENILYLDQSPFNLSEFSLSDESRITSNFINSQLTISIHIVLISSSNNTYTYDTQKTYVLP